MPACCATTKSGIPCKNARLIGQLCCNTHKAQNEQLMSLWGNKLSEGGMTHEHIQNNVQNWTAFADPTTYIEAMRIIENESDTNSKTTTGNMANMLLQEANINAQLQDKIQDLQVQLCQNIPKLVDMDDEISSYSRMSTKNQSAMELLSLTLANINLGIEKMDKKNIMAQLVAKAGSDEIALLMGAISDLIGWYGQPTTTFNIGRTNAYALSMKDAMKFKMPTNVNRNKTSKTFVDVLRIWTKTYLGPTEWDNEIITNIANNVGVFRNAVIHAQTQGVEAVMKTYLQLMRQ
jgi:hypothetical protein